MFNTKYFYSFVYNLFIGNIHNLILVLKQKNVVVFNLGVRIEKKNVYQLYIH